MMNKSINDKKTALLYVKLNTFKYLLDKTNRFIAFALSNIKNPYLACSFGKDSSVMLDLVFKQKADIIVKFASHPETRIIDNYDEVINWWIKKGIILKEIFLDGGLVKIKHAQRNALDAMQESWDSFFVGIRKQENYARNIHLKTYGKFHKLKNGRIKISPLADWTETDISAYILANDLPILSTYLTDGFSARTSAGIPRSCIRLSLTNLKNKDVNAFNKLCELYEDVKFFI